MEIYQKLAAIMRAVKPIGKDRKNEQQNFQFRGIDDVMNELHEAFAENGVFITTEVLSREETERTSAKGNALFYTKCTCKFTLHTTDGSSVSSIVIGEGMDSGDKGTNKAMSIALKYALLQMFLIPTAEPKDPDAESHEVKAETTARPAPQQTDDNRPWITDEQVKKAVARIEAGDAGVLDACKKAFKISKANFAKLAAAKPIETAEEITDDQPF